MFREAASEVPDPSRPTSNGTAIPLTEKPSPKGRERLRERIPIEHSQAHLTRRQGRRARYRGARKNLFNIRRAATVQNPRSRRSPDGRVITGVWDRSVPQPPVLRVSTK